ncbi:hypothetical protein AB7M35_004581 [Amorphus suaedae]
MTVRSRLPATVLALAACALAIARPDGAAAQATPSTPVAVSPPATGEPMVLVPPSPEAAEPKRRGGFGVFSPFRRPVPPPPRMDAIHRPTITVPTAQASVPAAGTAQADAAAAMPGDVPQDAVTAATAVPESARRIPLPTPHPTREATVATAAAPSERTLDPITVATDPGLSAELRNERALDMAAAAANSVVAGSTAATGAVTTEEPEAPIVASASAGVPVPRPRPGPQAPALSVAQIEVAALQPAAEPLPTGNPHGASAGHLEPSVASQATNVPEAISETLEIAEVTAEGETAGLHGDAPPAGQQSDSAEPVAVTEEHAPADASAPVEPVAHTAEEIVAVSGEGELVVEAAQSPSPHPPADVAEADPHIADEPETHATEPHGDATGAHGAETVADGGHGAAEEAHETSETDAGHGATASGHGDEVPAAPPLDLPSRLGGADATASGNAIAPPYQLVRTLQTLQDNIAGGSSAALAAQKVLLARLDRDLLAADPALWAERRNAEALVVYTLSGGRPEVTRELLSRDPSPNVDERLLRGALAYVLGRESEARKLLGEQDPLSLPTNLAGQVALAQATLTLATEPEKSLQLLDLARLLSPGTLVEEAALRREIYLVSEQNDVDKFEQLARQYLRRFRHSVYAGNFRQRFAAALTRMSFVDDPAQFQRLDVLLADVDDDSRRELYLVVARAAVNGGKTAVAAMAAERALQSAQPASRDRARALLYRGAALAVTPDGLMTSLDDLKAVDRRLLTPSDAALYDAAAATANLILTAPEGAAVDETAVAEASEAMIESEVLASATSAVEAVDTLLSETQ